MNTTLLGRPLLLVLVLALSWAAAVPLHGEAGRNYFTEHPETFLEQHPVIARQLYPQLLNAASDVTLILDRDIVVDMLKNYIAVETIDEGEAQAEEENERRKRDTTLSGGVDHQVNPLGHSIGASGTLEHAWTDNHSVSGTVGGTRDTISGLGSFDSLNTGLNYNYSPNDDTTFSLGAHRNYLPGGRTTTGGSAMLENSWDNNRHSLSGNVEVNRNDIPGFESFNTESAGVSYNYSPNRNTRLSLGASRNWTPFGSENAAGATFTHFFGR